MRAAQGLNVADVIVVGAGPAGSQTARRLAEGGADVLLLDVARFPREKPCGGVLGERAVEMAGPQVADLAEAVGQGSEVYYDGRLMGSNRLRAYFFRRTTLDAHLVGQAVEAGAVLREGVRVTGVEVSPEGAFVRSPGGPFSAQIVVGADGTNSVVGRSVGLSPLRGDSRYAALRAIVPVTPDEAEALGVANPTRQAVHFFSDLFGFAWVAPNRGAVNVGLGASVDKAAGLRERFARFVDGLGLKAAAARGAQIRYMPLPRVSALRVILTGDAGGFVGPWSGAGIEEGLAASEEAATVCLEALDEGNFSAASLARFDARCALQLRRLRGRGQWVKFADRFTRPGVRFPYWVERILREAAGLDTSFIARHRGLSAGFAAP